MADEFDDFFDDEPLDEEFEESLAQVEATYTASQAAHIPPSRPLGKGAESSYARGQPAHSNGRGGGGGPAVGRNGRIGGNDRFSAPPRQPAQQSFRPPLKRPRLGESPAASNASWAAPIVIDDDEESAPAVVLGDDGKMMVDYGAGQPPSAAVTGRTPVATSQPGADEVIVKNLGADPYDNDDTFWASEGIQEAEEEAVRMSQQLRTAPNQGRQAVSGPVSGRSPQRAARRAETGYQEGPSAQPDTELNARVKSLQEQVAKVCGHIRVPFRKRSALITSSELLHKWAEYSLLVHKRKETRNFGA